MRHGPLCVSCLEDSDPSLGRIGEGVRDERVESLLRKLELEGRATALSGDTRILNGTVIRLAGIEAPELDQPCSQNGTRPRAPCRRSRRRHEMS